ncbi:hypothetical protein AMJ44_12335 [candidate division WOR-1 bacterium DG_54_3]|uniref:Uncharacterized protein n=1 Tax=candidate division WOR-1 bacterium DG_54_3 TaxID=1703775 RepID=A0A0S7XQH9_UNCSA|nr:MAG: hypothetical protein AMJ44_12335 [candidate division WOR-1 bacterium DG_54_3]
MKMLLPVMPVVGYVPNLIQIQERQKSLTCTLINLIFLVFPKLFQPISASVAAVEVAIDRLLDDRPEEALLFLEATLILSFRWLKSLLDKSS